MNNNTGKTKFKLGFPRSIYLTFFALSAGGSEALILYQIAKMGSTSITGAGEVSVSLTNIVVLVMSILAFVGSNVSVAKIDIDYIHGIVDSARLRLLANALPENGRVENSVKIGEIHHLFGQVSTEALIFGVLGMEMYSAAVNVVALLLVATYLQPMSGLLILVVGGLSGTVLFPLRRVMFSSHSRATTSQESVVESIEEVLALRREILLFGVSIRARQLVSRHLSNLFQMQRKSAFSARLVPIAYVGVGYLIVSGLVSIASRTSPNQLESLGLSALVLIRSLSYGQRIQNGLANRGRVKPLLVRLRGSLTDRPQNDLVDNSFASVEIERHVSNLHFENSPLAIQLEGVRLDISDGPSFKFPYISVPDGEFVGITGPSGTGKSTLLRLISGELDPSDGRLLVFGSVPGRNKSQKCENELSLVPQDSKLLTGTVRENVAFFRTFSDDEIIGALKLAAFKIDGVPIENLLDHEVGLKGSALSGGERHRLAIARSLIQKPRLLLLDEPTAALDSETERRVLKNLQQLQTSMTIVVVSHDETVLEACDSVVDLGDERLRFD